MMADAKPKTEDNKKKAPTPDLSFEIKTLHKKALLKLLHCHHSGILLTYPELSAEIGTSEKTKAWQSGAWKDLKKGGYIVPGSKPKTFCLSTEGVELAMCFASEEELAEFRTPLTNEEHHEKIRNKLAKDTHKGKKHRGRDIFNVLLEDPDTSWTRLELGFKLGLNPESHSFFDGFKALERMGLLTKDGSITKEELVRKFEELSQKTHKTKKRKASEDEKDEQQKPQKKQRIRGGTQLFKLSEKAFLVICKSESKKSLLRFHYTTMHVLYYSISDSIKNSVVPSEGRPLPLGNPFAPSSSPNRLEEQFPKSTYVILLMQKGRTCCCCCC